MNGFLKNNLLITSFILFLLTTIYNIPFTYSSPGPSTLKNTPPSLISAPTAISLQQYPARTELSKKALHLRVGMTKKEIIALLGHPHFISNSESTQEVWLWQNEFCNPVEVIWDTHHLVVGFDEGRATCLDHPYQVKLSSKYHWHPYRSHASL